MMKKFFFFFHILLLDMYFAQSPGGVTGVNVWFKASSAQTPALIYQDYSGNQHEIKAVSTQNQPNYTLFNYNESLNFDGIDDYLKFPYLMETMDKTTFYTAYQNQNTSTETAMFTSEKSYEKELYFSTKNIFRYNNEQINYINTNIIDDLPSFSMYTRFGIPSAKIHSIIGRTGISSMYVGKDIRSTSWQNFKGKLPEFFIYRKILTQNERNRINSYLAVKYAVTMPYTEYFSSKSKKVWKQEDFVNYPANIAGIARDKYSGLYQKQATSSSENQRLIIAAKKLVVDNKSNDADFPDQSFLIWGDNKEQLLLNAPTSGYQLFKRKWKARFSTETSQTIPTEVVFSIKNILTIPTDKKLWLFIDKTGQRNFNSSNVEVYPMDYVDTDQNVHFNNIIFDQDLSGTDVFTFALGNKILSINELLQPTCIQKKGTLNINIKGGKPTYHVQLIGNGVNQNFNISTSQFSFPDLEIGNYHLLITDADGNIIDQNFTVNDFNSISLDLGPDVIISSGGSAHFDAGAQISDPNATYQWTSDNGFTSSSPSVTVYEPGSYTVTVYTPDGCTKKDTVIVTRKRENGIVLYPNPVPKGQIFTIRIISDIKENVDIKIYDASGRLVKTIQDKGKDYYEIKDTLLVEGAYIIVVKTTSELKVFKLIVTN